MLVYVVALAASPVVEFQPVLSHTAPVFLWRVKPVSTLELSVQPRLILDEVVPVTFSTLGASRAGAAVVTQLDQAELPNRLVARTLYEYVVTGVTPVFW